MSKETRVTPTLPMTVDPESRTLVGYGAVFNKPSQDLGGFTEVIEPGAFDRTLDHGGDVLCCVNHDVNQLLGRSASGTVKLSVDEVGVKYEVSVPDTTVGRDALAMAERGDLFGSSFTFSVKSDGERWEKRDGQNVRYLTEVRLFELGPVVSPAYLDTSVAARSLEDYENLASDEAENEEVKEEDGTRSAGTGIFGISGLIRVAR